MMKNKFATYLCAAVLLVFFGTFLFLPLYTVLAEGLDKDILLEVFRNRLYMEGLWNAFAISVVTTFFVFLIALPLAVLYDRYEFPGKNLCPILMMTPMILPPFVGALGFQQLLGHYGVLNSLLVSMGLDRIDFLGGEGKFWSICAMEALHLYPILYLNLITSLANIDPTLNDAAKNLGISPWKRFFRITLPLLRPGIFAGGSIVLIWSFTELGTPLMFGVTNVTPVQIFNGINELESNPTAYSLVIIMLAVSALMYLTGKVLLGSGAGTNAVKGMT
ncbi:MAG: iron ABC transporter permease, partial [Lentisphaeria bacterium]|nr:iron ABC transporter permease [Lentisphaeria bacterium]